MKRFLKAGLLIFRAWFRTGPDRSSSGSALAGSGIRVHWRRFTALLRMLRAWSAGRYTQVPATTLAFGILALVYLASPIDVISDLVPALGLLDDITVVSLVLGAIQKDLEKFCGWEEQERRTIDIENPAGAVS